jgi:hypothetical protein
MASEPLPKAGPPYPVEPWPPDDTEESVSGSDLHQTTITNLRLGVNQVARVGKKHHDPSQWRAFIQMMLIGCRRPNGSSYRTLPDVFVLPLATDENRPSLSMESEGPPLLVIEVLSLLACQQGKGTVGTDLTIAGYSLGRPLGRSW